MERATVQLTTSPRESSLMIASIRFLDTFAKQEGRGHFTERKLMADWIETRPLVSSSG